MIKSNTKVAMFLDNVPFKSPQESTNITDLTHQAESTASQAAVNTFAAAVWLFCFTPPSPLFLLVD